MAMRYDYAYYRSAAAALGTWTSANRTRDSVRVHNRFVSRVVTSRARTYASFKKK